MNSKLCLFLVVIALFAALATADPTLGLIKEVADEVLSTFGVHNDDGSDVQTQTVVHHHHHQS